MAHPLLDFVCSVCYALGRNCPSEGSRSVDADDENGSRLSTSSFESFHNLPQSPLKRELFEDASEDDIEDMTVHHRDRRRDRPLSSFERMKHLLLMHGTGHSVKGPSSCASDAGPEECLNEEIDLSKILTRRTKKHEDYGSDTDYEDAASAYSFAFFPHFRPRPTSINSIFSTTSASSSFTTPQRSPFAPSYRPPALGPDNILRALSVKLPPPFKNQGLEKYRLADPSLSPASVPLPEQTYAPPSWQPLGREKYMLALGYYAAMLGLDQPLSYP